MAKEDAIKTAKDKANYVEKLKEEHNSTISQLKESHIAELSKLKKDHVAVISQLKDKNDLALTNEWNTSYNEALSNVADEVEVVKKQIYKGGYEFGLVSAGLPPNHKLCGRVVLCPLELSKPLFLQTRKRKLMKNVMKNATLAVLVPRSPKAKQKILLQVHQM